MVKVPLFGSNARRKLGVDASQYSVRPVLHLLGHPLDVQMLSKKISEHFQRNS